ncbi:hypothetical protein OG562_16075 [Streptomyces sp. NBC_01275]|uniref:hypothetical protein n=1 Tax=Streptomyces sp. NBC_01275 TaxID=2903807 RepID=UPI002256E891|nr:hypothetical protein [Streptomyces sp. NBC_01275]MCX4762465.1 hypothetical protein [Streptomyces sp. NBC_01275]
MRRTTIHRTTFQTFRRTTAVAALTASALLLVGCGTEKDGGDAAGPAPTTVTTATGEDCAQTSAESTVTAADDGRTVCLRVGGQLRLTLDGTAQRPWSTVAAAGDADALKAANAGIAVQPGDALAAYEAAKAGTVRLTASRPLCAVATGPGQVSCKGIREWSVTVMVS